MNAVEDAAIRADRSVTGQAALRAKRAEVQLIASYPFDGDTRDASGSGLHGQVVGNAHRESPGAPAIGASVVAPAIAPPTSSPQTGSDEPSPPPTIDQLLDHAGDIEGIH